jgi:hypothetical protein
MKQFTLATIFVLGHANSALGTVQQFTGKASWLAAAGAHTAITFLGYPQNTNITTQYSNLGITFTDGIDLIDNAPTAFPNDGWGINGALDSTTLYFALPTTSLAADFPGFIQYKLFWHEQLIFTSNIMGGGGAGHFAGVVSDQPFDRAVILDPLGGLFFDDLYFGPPVPAPAALPLLALAALRGRSRRRV